MEAFDDEKQELGDKYLHTFVAEALKLTQREPSLFQRLVLPLALGLAHNLPSPENCSPSVSEAITEIWSFYLQNVVGSQPPPPQLALSKNRCTCDICSPINSFLADGTRKRYELRAPVGKRNHAERSFFDMFRRDIFTTTDTSGRPHKLIIAKCPEKIYNEEFSKWNANAQEAKGHLLEFARELETKVLGQKFYTALPEQSMRTMLGDSFDAIWRLRPSEDSPTGTSIMPSLHQGHGSLAYPGEAPSLVPAKRKAEENGVDLT